MSERHTRATVEFLHPFTMAGSAGSYPPGVYDVETIDEQLDGLSFLAYRRVSTTMTPRESDPLTRLRQPTEIDPEDLQDALSNDQRLHSASLATYPTRDGA
jgi:hypothetical protein